MDPVIVFLRVLIPLSILRFPFWGALASLWLDGVDWSANFFNIANLHSNYVALDKILDLYYLGIEAWIVLKWKSLIARKTGLIFFFIRAAGIVLFLIFAKEFLLFIFPNIFENFFLFYYGVWTIIQREPKLSKWQLFISLIILGIPKIIQEYVMHVDLVTNWRPVFIRPLNFTYDNLYGQLIIVVLLILAVSFLEKKKVRF